MVFLLQNTQNRDTIAIHLKLDEIIRSIEGAHNKLLKIEELSDKDLEVLHQHYEKLAHKVQTQVEKGVQGTGSPTIQL
jgi:low affinity Fe/Cu permease